MISKIVHEISGEVFDCDIINLDFERRKLTVRFLEGVRERLEQHGGDGTGRFFSDILNKYLSECFVVFDQNGKERKVKFSLSEIVLCEQTLLEINEMNMNDDSCHANEIYFRIPELELNLPCCMPLNRGEKYKFEYKQIKCALMPGKKLDDGTITLSTEDEEISIASCWNGSYLVMEYDGVHSLEELAHEAYDICWMLSLWKGRYVSWDLMQLFGEDDMLEVGAISPSPASDVTTNIKAYVCSAPHLFISSISDRYSQYANSWRYTIYWLMQAFKCEHAGVLNMITSMVFERITTALYCGCKSRIISSVSYFQRGKFCKEYGQGSYSKDDLYLIKEQRNAVMHGSDNLVAYPKGFRQYIVCTLKIIMSTVFALLGYKGSFSIESTHWSVTNSYKNVEKMSKSKLFFNYE